MKGSKKIALVLIAIMALSFFLAACGNKQPETLEAYVKANQSEQDAIQGKELPCTAILPNGKSTTFLSAAP